MFIKKYFLPNFYNSFINLVVILGIFFCAFFFIQKSILLDESIFLNTNFPVSVFNISLFNALKSLRFLGVFVFGVGIGIWFLGWKWNFLWKTFAEKMIFFVGISVLMLTFCFSPYNFYVEQWFIFDRILLGSLGIVCFFRPSFLFLFVLYIYFFASQFSYPFGGQGYEWTYDLWCNVLLLAWSGFFMLKKEKTDLGIESEIQTKTKLNLKIKLKANIFICVYIYVLTMYAYPAYQKMVLGEYVGQWIFENQIFHYLVAGDVQYWEFYEKNFIFFENLFKKTNILLAFLVIFIEIGFLAFWHKRYFQVLAFGRFMLHLGVFFFTGNTFWSWQLFNILLIIQIFYIEKQTRNIKDTENNFLNLIFKDFYTAFFLFFVILFGNYCFSVKNLSWWDSNFYQVYTLQAVDDAGNMHILTPYDYAPYTIWGRKAQFYYLHDEAYLTGTYGSTKNYALYKDLYYFNKEKDKNFNKNSQAFIKNIKTKFGKNLYNQSEKEKFIRFTKKLITHLQNPSAPTVSSIFSYIPLHFYVSFSDKNVKKFNPQKIQKIQVLYKEVLYQSQQRHKKKEDAKIKLMEKIILEVVRN